MLLSTVDRDLVRIIDKHVFPNLPIKREYLAAENQIFGPYLNALKGKTVLQNNPEVWLEIKIVPVDITILYKQVIFVVSDMFVNRILFLIYISLHPEFGTTECL